MNTIFHLRNLIDSGTSLKTGSSDGINTDIGRKAEASDMRSILWDRNEQNNTRTRRQRLENPLLDGLDKKLEGLENSLKSFKWPNTDFPWRNARLSVSHKDLEDKVEADIPQQEDVRRLHRFFSKGFDADDPHTLDTDTYTMRLSMGSTTKTLSVDLDYEDASWEDVLNKTADAINNSSLPVQAEVIYNQNSGQQVDDLVRTGTLLSVTVNPAYKDSVSFDNRDELTRTLDMKETSIPQLPATKTRWSLQGIQNAQTSSFHTETFDPNETASILQDVYSIAYELGGSSGRIDVQVESGDTWEDVLKKVREGVNLSQDGFKAELEYVDRPVHLEQSWTGEGVRLAIEAVSPKRGERLSLSPTVGPTQGTVRGMHDPSSGLPVGVNTYSYISTASGNGWNANSIYTHNGNEWVEQQPTQGDIYQLESKDYVQFDGTSWSAYSFGDILTPLGLNETAHPGADAKMTVNQQEQVSATGVFALDKGRVNVTLQEPHGEPLPLKVTQALDSIEAGVNDVVTAYNSLRTFLTKNDKMWDAGFAERWRQVIGENHNDFQWMGMQETGNNKLLWVDGDRFYEALFSEPDTVKDLLLGSSGSSQGLFDYWQQTAEHARNAGLEEYLVSEATLQDLQFPVTFEFENKIKENLLDLFT